jgi:hypothetical protein
VVECLLTRREGGKEGGERWVNGERGGREGGREGTYVQVFDEGFFGLTELQPNVPTVNIMRFEMNKEI